MAQIKREAHHLKVIKTMIWRQYANEMQINQKQF